MNKSKITAASVNKPTDDTTTTYSDKLTTKCVDVMTLSTTSRIWHFQYFFRNVIASNVKKKKKRKENSNQLVYKLSLKVRLPLAPAWPNLILS